MQLKDWDREGFMLDFHSRHTGIYTNALKSFRDVDGHSTYRFLARLARELPAEAVVLELGCADGYMLELLAEETPAQLVGLDISAPELELARQRLGDRAQLLCANARQIPMADASVDMVVSHGSIGVMHPIEPIIAEVARVLKPGGTLRYMVNHGDTGGNVFDAYMAAVREARKKEDKLGFLFGDPRVYRQSGLDELAAIAEVLFTDMESENQLFFHRDTPENLYKMLSCYYEMDMLTEKGRQHLREDTFRRWKELGDDAELTCLFGMRLMGLRKISEIPTA